MVRAKVLFGNLFTEKLFRQQLCYYKDIDFSEEVKYVHDTVSQATIESFLQDVALRW